MQVAHGSHINFHNADHRAFAAIIGFGRCGFHVHGPNDICHTQQRPILPAAESTTESTTMKESEKEGKKKSKKDVKRNADKEGGKEINEGSQARCRQGGQE